MSDSDLPRSIQPRRLDQVHSVRFDPQDAVVLREVATERGVTVSELLRSCAMNEINGARQQTENIAIIIRREEGCWWAEIVGHGEYVAGDPTFDGLCERLAEGLHLLGLNRERTAISLVGNAQPASASTSGQRTFTFWRSA